MHAYHHHRLFVVIACMAGLAALPRTTDAARSTLEFTGTVVPQGTLSLLPVSGTISHFGDEGGIRLTVTNTTRSPVVFQLAAEAPSGTPWEGFAAQTAFNLPPGQHLDLVTAIPHTSRHPDSVTICARPLLSRHLRSPCGRYKLKRHKETLPMM